ncbi:Uncharacterised protein [Actinobacillus pleuropneumoniae]|nr:Uncharacterised protein [Actinobacillus pleuropneumoniae]
MIGYVKKLAMVQVLQVCYFRRYAIKLNGVLLARDWAIAKTGKTKTARNGQCNVTVFLRTQ